MKKFILISASFLSFYFGINAQEYFPFPIENVNWNVYLISSCSEDVPPDTSLLRYSIHGDTTISEVVYNKLCLESGDTLSPNIQTIGGLREDDKKIFYIGQTILGGGYDDEYLLYDFTKQIGDTIKHDSYGGFYSVILNIDSIIIGESYRKRYKVDNHWFYHNPDYVLEGIGSVLNGLLGHISDIPTCGYHYWEHICFRENGVVKYLNPSFSDCFPSNFFTSISQLTIESDINYYPNPTKNDLLIENTSNRDELVVSIIDIYGRVLNKMPLNNTKTSIRLPSVSGVYTIRITDNAGKIIKQDKIIKL